MSRKFLAFDVETAKQFPGDFSDWRKHRPLGICCAAAVAGDTGEARLWHGVSDDDRPAARMKATELGELVKHLVKSKYSAELQSTAVTLVGDDHRVPFSAEGDSCVVCPGRTNGRRACEPHRCRSHVR